MLSSILLFSLLAAASTANDGTAREGYCPSDELLYNSKGGFCYYPSDIIVTRKDSEEVNSKGLDKIFGCPGNPWCQQLPNPCNHHGCHERPPPHPLCDYPGCHEYIPEPCDHPDCVVQVITCNHHDCPGYNEEPCHHHNCPPPAIPCDYPGCPGYPLYPPPYPDYSICPGFPGYPGYGHPVGKCPICNDKCKVHFLTDAHDCTVYYMCDWGRPIWKRCPAGLHFNPRLNVCDFVYRAGCAHTGRPLCE